MLSDLVYQWLAELLALIEEGGKWPTGTLHATAAFLLAKDPAKCEESLAYRVLLILPTLYR